MAVASKVQLGLNKYKLLPVQYTSPKVYFIYLVYLIFSLRYPKVGYKNYKIQEITENT